MYLEEKMRNTRMKKGERFDSLSRIQDTRDQLSVVGAAPRDSELVRLTLNSVSEDYQVFVQSILGRERLPGWEAMWAALQQEELMRDLLKIHLEDGSSRSKVKEEEDNTDLASNGKQKQKKKDLSKIIRCGEMGHYATHCPLKKKDKEEKEDP